MNALTLDMLLAAWARRHGLKLPDTYRHRFYYFDISDDSGGKYQITISKETQSDFIKVRVDSNRKRSCGFIGVPLTDLDEVLETAVSLIKKWIEELGKRRVPSPDPSS